MTEPFALRVRSVKMKNGGAEVRVLHRPESLVTEAIDRMQESSRAFSRLEGYVVFFWGKDMDGDAASACGYNTEASGFPIMMVADMVRNRIIQTVTERQLNC